MNGMDQMVLAVLEESGEIAPGVAAKVRREAAALNGDVRRAALSLSAVDARRWAIVAAEVCECPFVDLGDFEVNFANAKLIPVEMAESLRAFPLFLCDGVLTLGMADPLDFRSVDRVRGIARTDVDPVHCVPELLAALIERAYAIAGTGAGVSRELDVQPVGLTTGKEPAVAAVNQILAQGIELGASDIHVGADDQQLHLRYRVDGVLRSMPGPGVEAHAGIVQRLKVMADLDLTQTRRPQDGKFRFHHQGRDHDVRLSLIPTVCGENAVLRVLRGHGSIGTLAELGMSGEVAAAVERAADEPHGMILVTGPTGSGKTTTLYAILNRLNTPDVNIMTIEDPVEIRMPMVRQVQVNAGIGLTFAGALRSVLRQDPDVVLIGEIRDEETARIGVQAALTGHLVLTTLHTNDAAGAIPRLADLSCPAFAINAAVTCVLAQRLVRRVCADCVAEATPETALLARFGLEPGAGRFVKGAGCPRCAGLGMRGRMGIHEMLTMSPGVRAAVEAGLGAGEIRKRALADGMRTLASDGVAKAMLGLTTLEEVERATTTLDTQIAPSEADAHRRAA